MSGDVQPRKRKDKRRKKDASSSERAKAEAEYIARKLSVADDSDEGVSFPTKSSSSHSSNQPNEGDSIIHVHHEGGTGGHWCAKIVFFLLLGVLVCLIGLILVENRGLSDLDTPVAESRYAQVFDGWVDEGPVHDDHHDEHTLELKHEDEGSHEEGSDDEHIDEIEDIEDEHGETEDESEHSEDEETATDDNDDHNELDNEDDGDEENDNDQSVEEEADNNDNEEQEDIHEIDYDGESDEENEYLEASRENENNNDDGDVNDNIEDEENDDNNSQLNDSGEQDNSDLPFEEVDSMEEDVVDNTAGEEEHLAAKEAEQLAAAQEQEESGIGMRVGIGVALVVATYCVLARKWQNVPDADEGDSTDLNRRMTLISNEEIIDVAEREIEEKIESIKKNIPTLQSELPRSFLTKPKQIIHRYVEDDDEEEFVVKEPVQEKKETIFIEKVEEKKPVEPIEDEYVEEITREEIRSIETEGVEEDVEDASEVEEDVEEEEIIDEEMMEEEIIEEEEEDEDDISDDADDSDLMKKLEEKYGKLPQLEDDNPEGQSDDEPPITPARKKGKPLGGNNIEEQETEEWVDDSNDDWKHQMDLAQAEMDEGRVDEAFRLFTALSLTNKSCPLAKLGRTKAMDILAEKKRSNNLLQATIDGYLEILNMNINDTLFLSVAERAINRIRFRGRHVEAVPVHEKLIEKFPDNSDYRNQMAISYLMVNKVNMARKVLKETLALWPNDGVALVHYGFLLKTADNNLSEGAKYMQKGIEQGDNRTLEGRFLFHLGDAFARLGDKDKAQEIYEFGAKIGVFLSPLQRSLYNVDRLTGRPWWTMEETTYARLLKNLETNWKDIANEAKQLHPYYKPEQENLKDTGVWSQYELFVRGVENEKHCLKCPITCGIVRKEKAASGCRRGQIKFSAMIPGTHVFAHTGPTNCRLRAHLGLIGTNGTYIKVANEIRSWEEGKVFIFDDSFEHEVWHNGTDLRIVLIVDLWHPELTKEERLSLPSI